MGWISKIAKSADLASGMMDRLGSELMEDLMRNPETSTHRLAGVVFRCAGCSDQDGCAKLQAENAHLDHAPSYCRNKGLLERRARA
ncbi:DUF6455 family protein [Aestuariivita boseongensis]|uniref:DUF6455 family protein n=1 Tax=Aestuariivita boseongensis TaxID=1470562 RepID=UPI0006810EED|nr:DUF6455 family protein [Aestuariivita boseongensis]